MWMVTVRIEQNDFCELACSNNSIPISYSCSIRPFLLLWVKAHAGASCIFFMKEISKLQPDYLKNLQNMPHTVWRSGQRDGMAHWCLAVTDPAGSAYWLNLVRACRSTHTWMGVRTLYRRPNTRRVQRSPVSFTELVGGAEPLFLSGPSTLRSLGRAPGSSGLVPSRSQV